MKMIFNKDIYMKNIRKTKQKDYLIEYLKNNNSKHLSVEKIQNDLYGKVGLTTIYRILNYLLDKGLVSKISLENKQGFCYQYNEKNENCNNHYHLICEKCGKLIHFESDEIKKINEEANANNGFEIDNSKVVFYGICKNCKGK